MFGSTLYLNSFVSFCLSLPKNWTLLSLSLSLSISQLNSSVSLSAFLLYLFYFPSLAFLYILTELTLLNSASHDEPFASILSAPPAPPSFPFSSQYPPPHFTSSPPLSSPRDKRSLLCNISLGIYIITHVTCSGIAGLILTCHCLAFLISVLRPRSRSLYVSFFLSLSVCLLLAYLQILGICLVRYVFRNTTFFLCISSLLVYLSFPLPLSFPPLLSISLSLHT